MLEDEHPQHDGGGRPQSAPAPTLGMTPRQSLRHTIDEDIVVEHRGEAPKARGPTPASRGGQLWDPALPRIDPGPHSRALRERLGAAARTRQIHPLDPPFC